MVGETSLKFSSRGVARMARLVAAAGFALTLAACNLTSVPFINDNPPPPASAPVPHVQSQPLGGGAVGETVGTGPVRVGAILPLTQNGDPSVIGQSLRNAAQLAVEESGASDITLMIVDDHSTPDGAAEAAQQVVGAGAEIIVGPLFAADVVQAARAAKSGNRPMIAFSTDTTVASRGVYLLSFLIESYVDRIVDYAATHGKKSFAVLAPESDYGNVAVSEFQAAAGRLNARVVTIARYPPGQPATGVQQIAEAANSIDALFIPEQAEGMPAVSAALASSGLKAQILGTGVWNDPRVLKLPAVQGAWFAAPENPGFAAFSQRYKAKFNTSPTRLATLSYDAVSLVAALSRTQGPMRFSEAVLTNA
jgi:branched-chain amino acid transport system substrate-binding protein